MRLVQRTEMTDICKMSWMKRTDSLLLIENLTYYMNINVLLVINVNIEGIALITINMNIDSISIILVYNEWYFPNTPIANIFNNSNIMFIFDVYLNGSLIKTNKAYIHTQIS